MAILDILQNMWIVTCSEFALFSCIESILYRDKWLLACIASCGQQFTQQYIIQQFMFRKTIYRNYWTVTLSSIPCRHGTASEPILNRYYLILNEYWTNLSNSFGHCLVTYWELTPLVNKPKKNACRVITSFKIYETLMSAQKSRHPINFVNRTTNRCSRMWCMVTLHTFRNSHMSYYIFSCRFCVKINFVLEFGNIYQKIQKEV